MSLSRPPFLSMCRSVSSDWLWETAELPLSTPNHLAGRRRPRRLPFFPRSHLSLEVLELRFIARYSLALAMPYDPLRKVASPSSAWTARRKLRCRWILGGLVWDRTKLASTHKTVSGTRLAIAGMIANLCMEKTSEPTVEVATARANGVARPALTNPKLGAALTADYEALHNDMAQAAELAAEFQRRLSEKSNEFAILKQVFEKTRTDLGRLQADIMELRRERHALANEAMRAQAFEMRLNRVTDERDQLATELGTVRASLAAARNENAERAEHPNAVIAKLTARVEVLTAQRTTATTRTMADPELKAVVGAISDAVQRLTEMIDPKAPVLRKREPDANPKEPLEEHIDISFGS
jgi:hypothetical protein